MSASVFWLLVTVCSQRKREREKETTERERERDKERSETGKERQAEREFQRRMRERQTDRLTEREREMVKMISVSLKLLKPSGVEPGLFLRVFIRFLQLQAISF